MLNHFYQFCFSPRFVYLDGGGSERAPRAPEKMQAAKAHESPLRAAANQIIEALQTAPLSPAAREAAAFEQVMQTVTDNFVGQIAAAGAAIGAGGQSAAYQKSVRLLMKKLKLSFREVMKTVENNPALLRVLENSADQIFGHPEGGGSPFGLTNPTNVA